MDVRLSPEQKALRDSAAQVVGRLAATAVGQLDDTERAAKLDAAIAASGWRELRTPSDEGTPWASAVETAIVADELGRGTADAALIGPILATELRRLAGAPTADAETVVLDGDLAALATASDGTASAGAVAVDAAGSTKGLLLTRSGDGWALASVELPSGEVRVDLTRTLASVGDAPVSTVEGQTHVLTDEDLQRWTALALALTSADLVGIMRGAVELSTDYAKERRQYGQPVGSFQALQHMLADAFVAMEGSRSVALHAAWAVDALEAEEALAAGAIAKAYCTRAARSVCETAVQVHGGIGNTWECMAHVFLRRAMLSSDICGGTGPNLDRVLAHNGIGSAHGLR